MCWRLLSTAIMLGLLSAAPATAQNASPPTATPGERTQQNSADEAVPKGDLEAAQNPDDPGARQRSLRKLEDAAKKAKDGAGAPASNTGAGSGATTR
jgi:hypothetical protein